MSWSAQKRSAVALRQLGTFLICLLVALGAAYPSLGQSLKIGGKGFTEQRLMAELTGQLLRAKGYDVTVKPGYSTTGIRREQELGSIDIYWEYTGTALWVFNNISRNMAPDETYRLVKELDAKKGLIWLAPSRVNNTYALAMRRSDAEAKGISSISDLAGRSRQGSSFRLACNTEFFIRADGLLPLQRAYQFELKKDDILRTETDKVYDLLRDGAVDVGLVFATDGRIATYDLMVLSDNRNFFPSYLLTPVIRASSLDKKPEVALHLNALSSKLSNGILADLNAMIDVHKRSVEEVAATFLQSSGLR
jgi:osmoprotectant transport system substrate-binding protein